MAATRERLEVLAVVRIESDGDLTDHGVTINEILPTAEEAAEEVSRLNELNEERGCRYFWTATRYFPKGR